MLTLNATAAGAGPPVCLLHGLFGRAQNLASLGRRLAATHRVVALDLRNHGASPHWPGMAYVTMADDVLHTLRGLGALPCALLGHSMGGKVAMVAALTAPQHVSRLLVADIAPLAYAHANAAVAAALRGLELRPGIDRRGADAALAGAVPDPAVRAFLLQNLAFGRSPAWKIGLAEIAAGLADIEGWPAELAGCAYAGPTLFVAGGRSNYVQPDSLPAIRAFFPAARVTTLPRAGHWVHVDQADDFAAVAAGFLAE